MKTLSYILRRYRFEFEHYLTRRRDRKRRRRAYRDLKARRRASRPRNLKEENNSKKRALMWLVIMLSGCVTVLLLTFVR